jgi:hypothetical protein
VRRACSCYLEFILEKNTVNITLQSRVTYKMRRKGRGKYCHKGNRPQPYLHILSAINSSYWDATFLSKISKVFNNHFQVIYLEGLFTKAAAKAYKSFTQQMYYCNFLNIVYMYIKISKDSLLHAGVDQIILYIGVSFFFFFFFFFFEAVKLRSTIHK